MSSAAPSGLARRSIGTGSLMFLSIGASAPMTVLAGAVVATFAVTGVVGVPLSFLLLTVALLFFTVGYTAVVRYVSSAGVFSAILARGLGRSWSTGGALVALLSYNAIQTCLYGLAGSILSGIIGGPWWLWALAFWAIIGFLGVRHIAINARVLAIVLVLEVALIVAFDITSFSSPAVPLSSVPLMPENLFTAGVGGVFAFAVASFVGFETTGAFSEEARSPEIVSRATIGALLVLGIMYAISSWAMAAAVGPDAIAESARTDPNLPFTILAERFGAPVADAAIVLMAASILGAMISFHNTVARYVFALSRERVLPPSLGRIAGGSGGGSPVGGSLVQSAIGLVVILVFAVLQLDPVLTLFTWFSAVAAVGVMLLMVATCIAVVRFFHIGGGRQESIWQRMIAPVIGAVLIGAVLVTTVANLDSVVGGSLAVTLIIPALVVATLIAGLWWGLVLKRTKPEVYAGLGEGQKEPLAVLEHSLYDVRV